MSSLKVSLLFLFSIIILASSAFHFIDAKRENEISSRICLENNAKVELLSSTISFRHFYDSGNIILKSNDDKNLCSDYNSNFIQIRNNRLNIFEFSIPNNFTGSKFYIEISRYQQNKIISTKQIEMYQLPGSSYHYLALDNNDKNIITELKK